MATVQRPVDGASMPRSHVQHAPSDERTLREILSSADLQSSALLKTPPPVALRPSPAAPPLELSLAPTSTPLSYKRRATCAPHDALTPAAQATASLSSPPNPLLCDESIAGCLPAPSSSPSSSSSSSSAPPQPLVRPQPSILSRRLPRRPAPAHKPLGPPPTPLAPLSCNQHNLPRSPQGSLPSSIFHKPAPLPPATTHTTREKVAPPPSSPSSPLSVVPSPAAPLPPSPPPAAPLPLPAPAASPAPLCLASLSDEEVEGLIFGEDPTFGGLVRPSDLVIADEGPILYVLELHPQRPGCVLLRRVDLEGGREELVCHWGPDGQGGRVRAWNPSSHSPRLDDLEIAALLDLDPPEAMALHLALPRMEQAATDALALLLRGGCSGGGGAHPTTATGATAACGIIGQKRRRAPSPARSGFKHATPPPSLPASPSRPYTTPTSQRPTDVAGRGKRRRMPSAKAANA